MEKGCPNPIEIEQIKFKTFVYEKAVAKRIPLVGVFELTHRCNLHCVHCFIPKDLDKTELSYRQICDILDQLCQKGCIFLCFTGGEVFSRSDFIDIYIYAKNLGFIIVILTNGTLITPHIADVLNEFPPFSVEISIYGATKKTYESITGVQGSFELCQRGINLLLDRGIPFKLKTMLLSLNKHEIWQMKDYAKNLGLKFRFDPRINSSLNGSKDPCIFRLPPEELIEFDLADRERIKEWREFHQKFKVAPSTDYIYTCAAGRTSFVIDAYGKLQFCILSRHPNYDILSGSFHEGWQLFPQIYTQKITRDTKCRHCDLVSLCGQCPGWAELENGDIEEPVEHLCQAAHLRAKKLGL